ncbi:MAG: glycosyltransferase [Candidatus Aureabacteria bacterium]|nr:glycosyltransferase [Candidatus Auribacterota bacterium]
MLRQKIRIGFPLIGSKEWIGGITYIEMFVKAINTLEPEKKPKLYLIIYDHSLKNYELYKYFISYFDGILFTGMNLPEALEVLGKNFIYCFNEECLYRHIDFYYPVLGATPVPCPFAFWIPDFQHFYYPELFSKTEANSRTLSYQKIAYESAYLVLSSQSAQNDFYKIFPHPMTKTRVLPFYALQEKEWFISNPLEISKKYKIPEKYLICCNQFWAHKNHLCLFKAISELKKNGITIPIVCTGSTRDYRNTHYMDEIIEQIKKLGIHDEIYILGNIPRLDQIALIRQSMAIIQPSLFEGWSTVVEDARILGKTIILSDLPVHLEQATPYARYFKRNDYWDLKNNLEKLLPDLFPGPDIEKEKLAPSQSISLVKNFATQFMELVLESVNNTVNKSVINSSADLFSKHIVGITYLFEENDFSSVKITPTCKSLLKFPRYADFLIQYGKALKTQNKKYWNYFYNLGIKVIVKKIHKNDGILQELVNYFKEKSVFNKEEYLLMQLITKFSSKDFLVRFYFNLGKSYEITYPKKSSTYYNKALKILKKIQNKNIVQLYRMASCYMRINDFKKTKELFGKIINKTTISRLISGSYFHLGEVALEEKDLVQAKEYFNKCLALVPDHQKAKEYIAAIQIKT